MAFVLRTESSPLMLAGAVREAVQSIDKNQPLSGATKDESSPRLALAESTTYGLLS
jgi:hypothetical protein